MEGTRNDDWQQRYEKSIRVEEERIAEAEANEAEWSKLLDRATYTGAGLDLLLLPVVIIIFGIPALRRHLRNRKQRRAWPSLHEDVLDRSTSEQRPQIGRRPSRDRY